jgi:hypothetical protein
LQIDVYGKFGYGSQTAWIQTGGTISWYNPLGCAWLSRKKKERVRDERVTREMTISLGWQGSEIGESD